MVARDSGLIRRHQRPDRHAGLADAAGYGRGDPGVPQIDAGRFNCRLPILNLGPGLVHGGRGVVVVLPADRFVHQQFLVAFGPQPDRGQIGLGLAQGGLGRVKRHLKGGGINLVKQLSGFDIGALPEQALLDDAIDLRADFRHQVGRGAARQLGGQLNLLRLNGHHGHFRDREPVACGPRPLSQPPSNIISAIKTTVHLSGS